MTSEDLIHELRKPSCYPSAPASVELIQTHLSIVCLAGDLVYKLKKSITLPFVDFAPLAARRHACREEVRLNRRLCPDTYLGAASLRRTEHGLRFAEVGDDEGDDDVDVAVVMRRMPQDRMLDELVRDGSVTEAQVRELAGIVARFHKAAERGDDVATLGDPRSLSRFAAANFDELAAIPDHGLPAQLLAQLAQASAADFTRVLPELQRRAASGFVVDGHGDLHTRNVCMTSPPAIYDCIEFEPAFRCGDVATEIAFLAMDLRYRGAPELAEAFVDAYAAQSGDERLAELLPTLCGYRAMVRAKVAALAAAESELPEGDRVGARQSAYRHVVLASSYAIETRGPLWIVVCGPPASGKSSLCRELAALTHWPQLATDVVRKQLAGIAAEETARAEHYTAEFSKRTYGELQRLAAEQTAQDQRVVLLDGNFPSAEHRRTAAAAARQAGAQFVLLVVEVDPQTAMRRAEARSGQPGNVSDADADVTKRLHGRFVAPADDEGLPVLRLDGTKPTVELANESLGWLLDTSQS